MFISQLIRYAKSCFAYEDFSKRNKLLTNKLMMHDYIMNFVQSHIFADSTVVIMTLIAITNYHWLICWMICFIQFVSKLFSYWFWRQVIRIPNSTKGLRQVWPASRGCILLLGTWSCLRIFRGSVLLCNWFPICFLDFDYLLHIGNFVILYIKDRCV
jgi:hypothetical protein